MVQTVLGEPQSEKLARPNYDRDVIDSEKSTEDRLGEQHSQLLPSKIRPA